MLRACLVLFAFLLGFGCGPAGGHSVGALGPPGPKDLIVFIARYKPNLYRLVGRNPEVWGTARFYNPVALTCDQKAKCFYVLDQPKMIDEEVKIWRIQADGSSRVVYKAPFTTKGGPFDRPVSLGLDSQGRVLVADLVSGLWRLEKNGSLQRLLDGKTRPWRRVSAAWEIPGRGVVLATSYQYEITGGDIVDSMKGRYKTYQPSPRWTGAIDSIGPFGELSGHQIPIRVWKVQGGLFLFKPDTRPVRCQGLLVNRKQGGEEYDTLWRTVRQVFVDNGGRIILVDSGSKKTFTQPEKSYRGDPRIAPRIVGKRTLTSEIAGGILVLHPDGRLEDLTFKTRNRSSAPMRRPRAIAQWSEHTYVVADPEMHERGMNGSGGLLLLDLDGTRRSLAPFGYRLKPYGVAILRLGPPGPPRPEPAVQLPKLDDLAGRWRGGEIKRFNHPSWEIRDRSATLLPRYAAKAPNQAQDRLRSIFVGAVWRITKDGSLQFRPNGAGRDQTRLAMAGTVTVGKVWIQFDASKKTQSLFDTRVAAIEGQIQRAAKASLQVVFHVTIMNDDERIQGEITQVLARE